MAFGNLDVGLDPFGTTMTFPLSGESLPTILPVSAAEHEFTQPVPAAAPDAVLPCIEPAAPIEVLAAMPDSRRNEVQNRPSDQVLMPSVGGLEVSSRVDVEVAGNAIVPCSPPVATVALLPQLGPIIDLTAEGNSMSVTDLNMPVLPSPVESLIDLEVGSIDIYTIPGLGADRYQSNRYDASR